jgi:hypothetical protein
MPVVTDLIKQSIQIKEQRRRDIRAHEVGGIPATNQPACLAKVSDSQMMVLIRPARNQNTGRFMSGGELRIDAGGDRHLITLKP